VASGGQLATTWTTRYEALRRQVLEDPGGGGEGLVLLQRRGLALWMQTWPIDASAKADEGAAQQSPEAIGVPEFLGGLTQEITRILVNMLLHHAKEAAL
jgi:hypothetical protein